MQHLFLHSINLPITVDRSVFDRELDYYGITDGGMGTITQDSFAKTMQSLAQATIKHDVFFLALECSSQFCPNYSGSSSVHVRISEEHKLFKKGYYLSSEENKLFGEYLGGCFGLKVDEQQSYSEPPSRTGFESTKYDARPPGYRLPRPIPNRGGYYFKVSVKSNGEITQGSSLAKTMISLVQDKMKHDTLYLAQECFAQFGQKYSGSSVSVVIGKGHKLYDGKCLIAVVKK